MLSLALLVSALGAGVLGSVHCVAMCGLFAASAGARGRLAASLYSAGRLSSYAAIGAVAGGLGSTAQMALGRAGWLSQSLAIALGVALIAIGLAAFRQRRGRVEDAGPLTRLYARLVPLARACVASRRPEHAYLLGVINGLLPCPIVAPLALAAAASGSAPGGALVLLSLGLGTLPAMLAVGRVGARITTPWGGRLARLAVLVLGVVTAVRPFIEAGTQHAHSM